MPDLARMSAGEFKQATKFPIVVILDDVRSMNNVGSVFRTADSFLIEAIYLCGFTPTPPHRDIQKTALGATETVQWKHVAETKLAVEELRKDGYLIYSVEQVHGSLLLNEFTIDIHKKTVLVFGNEVNGVHEDIVAMSDAVIEIPQFGSKHSLNIAVSAGIVLWEVAKQYANTI